MCAYERGSLAAVGGSQSVCYPICEGKSQEYALQVVGGQAQLELVAEVGLLGGLEPLGGRLL